MFFNVPFHFVQAVDIRQIYDKFPEKKGGLKELYDKGPQSAFFLVKFWVSGNTQGSREGCRVVTNQLVAMKRQDNNRMRCTSEETTKL